MLNRHGSTYYWEHQKSRVKHKSSAGFNIGGTKTVMLDEPNGVGSIEVQISGNHMAKTSHARYYRKQPLANKGKVPEYIEFKREQVSVIHFTP